MKKRVLSLFLFFIILLQVCPFTYAKESDISEHKICVNCDGIFMDMTVLKGDTQEYYAPITWLSYFGLMHYVEQNGFYKFYYPGQEKNDDFAKRIWIDKEGKGFDVRYYRDTYSWFDEAGSYYEWAKRSIKALSEQSMKQLQKEWHITQNNIEENKSEYKNSFSVLSGNFSKSFQYKDMLYLPLSELLPLMNAQVAISDDGILCILPNCISLSQALYGTGFGDLIFDADSDMVASEVVSVGGWISDTLFNFRIDRLDVIWNTGRIQDYEEVFKSLLVENKAYLSRYDDWQTPQDELREHTSLSFSQHETYMDKLEFTQGRFENLGMIATSLSNGNSLYEGIGNLFTGAAYVFEGAGKILDYHASYVNQVEDHRIMLSSVYDYNAESNPPSRQAAKNIQALYGRDFSDKSLKLLEEGLYDFITDQLVDKALEGLVEPYAMTVNILKTFLSEEFEVVHNASLLYVMDATTEKAFDVYLSRKYSDLYDQKSLNDLRLSAIMALLSSRYAYSKLWSEDYEKIPEIDALLQKLYLAADGVACDSSDYYKPKMHALKKNIGKLQCVLHLTGDRPSRTRYCSALEAQYYADEKNGYSIQQNGKQFFCVDSQGYKTFDFDSGEKQVTYVYNGVLWTKKDDVYTLRNAYNGEIVFNTAEDPNVHVFVPQYANDPLFRDGYVFAYSKEESYDGVVYKIGYMSTQGEWISELSETHPILATIRDAATVKYFKESLSYKGDGIVSFSVEGIYYLYNILTNTVHEIKATGEVSNSDIDDILSCTVEFRDGVAVGSYGLGWWISSWAKYYKLYADGTIDSIPLDYSGKLNEKIGNLYFDFAANKVVSLGYTYHQDGFSVFDSKGEILSTYENLEPAKVQGFYHNGLAQLVVENKEGTGYYTVLNSSGELLFEPMLIDAQEIFDIRGNRMATWGYGEPGRYIVVDDAGEIVFEVENAKSFDINNGIIQYKLSEKDLYIYHKLENN